MINDKGSQNLVFLFSNISANLKPNTKSSHITSLYCKEMVLLKNIQQQGLVAIHY